MVVKRFLRNIYGKWNKAKRHTNQQTDYMNHIVIIIIIIITILI